LQQELGWRLVSPDEGNEVSSCSKELLLFRIDDMWASEEPVLDILDLVILSCGPTFALRKGNEIFI
jgi:hypothetical protein